MATTSMPAPALGPCPKCQKSNAVVLDTGSRVSRLWRIRCCECAHFWSLPKDAHSALDRELAKLAVTSVNTFSRRTSSSA